MNEYAHRKLLFEKTIISTENEEAFVESLINNEIIIKEQENSSVLKKLIRAFR